MGRDIIKIASNGQWTLQKSYKQLAESGLSLLYPAVVLGKHTRSDGIIHHATVKFFDKEGVSNEQAHKYANEQNLSIPDAKNITVIPKIFKNRLNEDVHVLSLHGDGVDHIKIANANASELGLPVKYDFQPHISVDKDTFDRVAAFNRPVRADEIGIKFMPAELRSGQKVLATYNQDSTE